MQYSSRFFFFFFISPARISPRDDDASGISSLGTITPCCTYIYVCVCVVRCLLLPPTFSVLSFPRSRVLSFSFGPRRSRVFSRGSSCITIYTRTRKLASSLAFPEGEYIDPQSSSLTLPRRASTLSLSLSLSPCS